MRANLLDLSWPKQTGAALFGLGAVMLAETAMAQPSQSQISAIRSNCRSDYMAHCSSVPPGGADSLHCLQQNESRLSSACRGAVEALRPPAAPASAPAAAPAKPSPAATPVREAAAPTARPAPARQAAAPAEKPAANRTTPAAAKPPSRQAARAADPAPAAAAWPPYEPMPPLPIGTRIAIVRTCEADRQAMCSMVPVGHDRIVDCLVRNAPVLSLTCQQALAAARASASR